MGVFVGVFVGFRDYLFCFITLSLDVGVFILSVCILLLVNVVIYQILLHISVL